jgi:hypothetical protein
MQKLQKQDTENLQMREKSLTLPNPTTAEIRMFGMCCFAIDPFPSI